MGESRLSNIFEGLTRSYLVSIEQFANGITIISIYLNPLPNSSAPPIENSIYQVMKEASLLFCLPDNPFFLPKSAESHAVQEATYACELHFWSPSTDL